MTEFRMQSEPPVLKGSLTPHEHELADCKALEEVFVVPPKYLIGDFFYGPNDKLKGSLRAF